LKTILIKTLVYNTYRQNIQYLTGKRPLEKPLISKPPYNTKVRAYKV